MSTTKNKSDKFPLPQCWSDPDRMDVLFSPFRPRNVNPENYDSKMKFWKGMISKYCEYKGTCNFCKSELQICFKRNNKIAFGLQNVIDDMIANKEIRLKSEFLNDPLNTWQHWAVNNFIKKPFSWSVNFVSATIAGGASAEAEGSSSSASGASGQKTDEQYIHLDVLQNQSEALLKRLQQKQCEKVLPLEKIIKLEKSELNNEGISLCLHYLNAQKKLFVQEEDESEREVLVKIAGEHEIAPSLTETDLALFKLEQIQERILKEIEKLECDMKLNDDKCRQYMREGKKSLAKSYLKKKHFLENLINKKHNCLDNIHSLLIQVQEAQSHGEILDAYKIGSNTLKNILSNPELNLDTIDEITDNVKETMEIHDEIQNTLGIISSSDSVEDDSLLETELNDLLNENKGERSTATSDAATGNKLDDELLKKLEKLKVETSLLLLADNAMDNPESRLGLY